MSNLYEWLRWIFGSNKVNCNCNRSRKDGYHNKNCASWRNARPDKRFIPKLLKGGTE